MFLRRFIHWGPILAVIIIKCITYSTLQVASMCFNSFSSASGIFCYAAFVMSVGLTLYHFFCAALIGPGYLPLKWKPANEQDCDNLQFCPNCEGYKAPRAHHCRKCNRCVMKMDHHCPWINNCCGHFNQAHFCFFLIFAVLGSIQSSIYLSIGLYRAFNYRYYVYYLNSRSVAYFSLYHLIFTIFSLGLAIGVVLALSGLFTIQMKSILKNETNIESWIVTKAKLRQEEKAYYRRQERARRKRPDYEESNEIGQGDDEDSDDEFVYPYNLGRWENFKFVFLTKGADGIRWPVVENCNQYTLTREQLHQKVLKKERSEVYDVVEDYSGSIFPISKGVRTCFSPPCSDEPRLPLSPGDRVLVTRRNKKRWWYGERLKDEPGDNLKGWFPSRCTQEPRPKRK